MLFTQARLEGLKHVNVRSMLKCYLGIFLLLPCQQQIAVVRQVCTVVKSTSVSSSLPVFCFYKLSKFLMHAGVMRAKTESVKEQ